MIEINEIIKKFKENIKKIDLLVAEKEKLQEDLRLLERNTDSGAR